MTLALERVEREDRLISWCYSTDTERVPQGGTWWRGSRDDAAKRTFWKERRCALRARADRAVIERPSPPAAPAGTVSKRQEEEENITYIFTIHLGFNRQTSSVFLFIRLTRAARRSRAQSNHLFIAAKNGRIKGRRYPSSSSSSSSMDCPRLPTLVTGTINISTLPTGNHGQRAGDLCLSVSFFISFGSI